MKSQTLAKAAAVASAILIPVAVIAQTIVGDPGAKPDVGIQFQIPWGTIVESLFGLLTAFVTYLVARMKANSDVNTAQGQIIHLADVLQSKVWARLTPEVRAEVAKGNWKKVETEVLAAVKEAAIQEVGEGFVTNMAKTLKLPMPSVLGTVAGFLIERYLNAHDGNVRTASAMMYPVQDNGG